MVSCAEESRKMKEIREEVRTAVIEEQKSKKRLFESGNIENQATLQKDEKENATLRTCQTPLPRYQVVDLTETSDHRTPGMKLVDEVRKLRDKFKECFDYYLNVRGKVEYADHWFLNQWSVKSSACLQTLRNNALAFIDYENLK
jgi:hypothetical protein